MTSAISGIGLGVDGEPDAVVAGCRAGLGEINLPSISGLLCAPRGAARTPDIWPASGAQLSKQHHLWKPWLHIPPLTLSLAFRDPFTAFGILTFVQIRLPGSLKGCQS